MKLDKTNNAILRELHHNCRIADTQLAKKIGKSVETTRYRIAQLEKTVIRGYSLIIDPGMLGFISGKIYLKTKRNTKRLAQLTAYLHNNKNTFWYGVANGFWDIGITFFCENQNTFFQLKNELTSQFSDIITQQHIANIVEVSIKTLDVYESKTPSTNIQFWTKTSREQIDTLDYAIISLLFKNARESLVQIAVKLESNVETIRQRIKKLQKQGIIQKFSAQLDFTQMGFVFYKTFLKMTNLTQNQLSKIEEFYNREPNILHMVKQIADYDIEFEIIVSDHFEYLKLVEKIETTFYESLVGLESAIIHTDVVFPQGIPAQMHRGNDKK